MKTQNTKMILASLFLTALSTTGYAKEWQIDLSQSKLTFVGDQSGEKFQGGFKTFAATISLDPDHPETGKINVNVDIASAYAGSSDRDSMLPQKDWFNTSKFPQAQFISNAIRKTAEGQYEVAANLTIKGITKQVTLPFTLVPEGDHWRAQGKVTLMRNDFTVGQGSFTGESYVKNDVDVMIDLSAKPKS